MCGEHWRLCPREVRKAWSITIRQLHSMPTPASRLATIENLHELCRIVRAIELAQVA
jgi:hypothetical protein